MVGRSGEDLAKLLGDYALELQNQNDIDATLRAIVDGAVDLVPGARWAGVSMIERQRVTARAPSDPVVVEMDDIQAELDEGPCLSALREHQTVLINDMAAETRWPRFTQAALQRGVRSLLSFQLFVHDKSLGALNLYGADTAAFNEDSLLVGEILAQHASVAVVTATSEAQLRAAVASRDLIGQAKGLLMHQRQLSGEQAFQLLVKTSQRANIKIFELSRWIVEQHESSLARRSSDPNLP